MADFFGVVDFDVQHGGSEVVDTRSQPPPADPRTNASVATATPVAASYLKISHKGNLSKNKK